MGIKGPDGKDAAGVADGENMIICHLSVTWGRDENFSINSTTARNITIQNSIIGQGLQNHSCGGLMQPILKMESHCFVTFILITRLVTES